MSYFDKINQNAQTLWHVQRVKGLFKDIRDLGPLALITVTQLDCEDPGCEGPVTQITLQQPGVLGQIFMVHKPLKNVGVRDLKDLIPT